MEIRDATRADLAAVVALLADDELGRHREDPTLPLDPAYEAAFAAIEADPNHRVVVGVEDGEVVATIQLSFLPNLAFRGGWRAQIEAVRVARHRRDGGLGRALFDWAIAEADQRGCHLVQLTTNDERGDAHGFYTALGFEGTHRGMKRYLRGSAAGR
jgi:GNAT superfamily N-acetyltransferase